MAIVYLNVGGTIFQTTKETLELSEYFQAALKYGKFSKEEPYFIDRDPKIFRHVLNLLRNHEYKYPEKYLDELEFYCIEYEKEIDDQGASMKLAEKIDNILRSPNKADDIVLEYDRNIYTQRMPPIPNRAYLFMNDKPPFKLESMDSCIIL